MKKHFLLYFILVFSLTINGEKLNAQKKAVDSLYRIINSSAADTVKLEAYKRLLNQNKFGILIKEIGYDAGQYFKSDLKLMNIALHYVDSIISTVNDRKKINTYLRYKAAYLDHYSHCYSYGEQRDYDKVLNNEIKIFKIKTLYGDKDSLANLFESLGYLYNKKGEHQKQLKCLFNALNIYIKNKNYKTAANLYYNIGDAYSHLSNNFLDKYYYYLSFTLTKEIVQNAKNKNSNTTSAALWNNFEEQKSSSFSLTSGIIGMLTGFLFSLSILHFFLYIFYSSGKSHLYYSLYSFCSSLALFVLLYYFCFPFSQLAFFTSDFTQDILSSLTSFFLLLFLYSLFYPKPLKFIYVFVGLLLVYVVFYKPINIVSDIALLVYQVLIFIEFVRVIIKARQKKKEEARLFSTWMWITLILFSLLILLFITILFSKVLSISGTVVVPDFLIYSIATVFCLTYLNFSIVISVFLAKQVAKTNNGLKKQIVENQELSEKMLQQEIEKKKILESQNEQLEIKVNQRTAELVRQKEIVEIKQQEILDSISYAQRIQNSILPPLSEIKNTFPQSFILFKPKDIVSGDFYWFEIAKQKSTADAEVIFIAACDCTGHGVPGAFMSTIGSEKLNETVAETDDVARILELVNKKMKKVLHQSDTLDSSRDGMDIALLKFNKEFTRMDYSGANRPLWMIRNTTSVIEEIKPTKRAIGGHTEDDATFVKHTVDLNSNDVVYIFTDGFADQFSREDKKLMTSRFKEVLLSIANKPMEEQKNYLNNFIDQWKEGVEQTDDILVIGIRV